MTMRIGSETLRNDVGLPVLAALISLLFGASFAILPPIFPVAAMVAIAILVIVMKYPIVGLILTMGFVYRVIPVQLAVEIPLGSFKAKPYELLLILTIASVITKPNDRASLYYGKETLTRIDLSSAVIISTMLFSFFLSRFILGNSERSIIEARDYFGLLALPLIPRLITSNEDWSRLVKVMIFMGSVIAAYVLIQMATGFNIMGGRLEDLELSKNSGVRRSVLFGGSLVTFAIFHLSEITNRTNFSKTIPFLILIAAGIIGTFTRTLWVSAAAGALLVAFLNGGIKSVVKSSALGVIAVATGLTIAAVVQPKAAEAAINRAIGIGTEFQSGDSYGWRVRENEFAYRAIVDHPLTGVGLGGRYKPIEWSKGAFENADYFIHNAYIGVVLKMGAIGILFLLTIIMLYKFAWQAGHSSSNRDHLMRRNSLAGVMLGFLLGGFVSPSFLKFHGFLFLSICIVGTLPPTQPQENPKHES